MWRLRGPCNNLNILPGTTHSPTWVASPRVPPKVLGHSRRFHLGAGWLATRGTNHPSAWSPHLSIYPSFPPQRAIGLPALPESSLQTVVAPGPGPSFLGCHLFPSGHRAHICQVSSKLLLLPRAESQKAPTTALAYLGPSGPPPQPLLLLMP